MNANQIAKVRAMLANAKLTDQKETLCLSFSNNRTKHLSELKYHETQELIAYLNRILNQDDPRKQKLLKKIFALAFEMRWTKEDGKLNMDRLNNWCVEYSYKHCVLDGYNYEELPKLISQFEAVYKSFLKGL